MAKSLKTGNSELASAKYAMWGAIIAAAISGGFTYIASKPPPPPPGLSDVFNMKLPVGTVIASMLSPSEFQEAGKDYASDWLPADGRDLPENSPFANNGARSAVPNLRGMFLRGLNAFTSDRAEDSARGDPDGYGRIAGSRQEDEIKKHTHGVTDPGHEHQGVVTSAGIAAAGTYVGGNADRANHTATSRTGISIDAVGGTETRPKNIAVYYYIKIR